MSKFKKIKEDERLHTELAKALGYGSLRPILCDLVAVAGKNKRDLNEATRILNSVLIRSRDHHLCQDIERFLKKP